MINLHDTIERKFVESFDVTEWEIETDTGWEDISHSNKTVEYEVWEIETDKGTVLKGADTHILIDKHNNEVFIKDSLGISVKSLTGDQLVTKVNKLAYSEHMYDLTVASENHTYYSNGLLSHNTTVAAGYLLWYAMFKPNSTILVAAHKQAGASEIMQRIRFAYESIPDHIRAGVTEYNKNSITFDSGSRIVSTTTTENSGRGMSLTLVYLDEFEFVPLCIAKEFWTSLSPTLSTGGKCIITSTPNSDEDQFAQLWHEANKTTDAYGIPIPGGVGVNGFKPLLAIWSEHPERDDAWADSERAKIGEERFRRENECCNGNTKITLKDETGQIFNITMEELFDNINS